MKEELLPLWEPSAAFKKLAADLHEIRVGVGINSIEKAFEMKRLIEMFLRSTDVLDQEREKVRELLLRLQASKTKRDLEAVQKISAKRN